MKTIKYETYGSPDVLKLVEAEKPEPGDNEILLKIHATTVTATEATFRKGQPYISRLFTGLLKPKLTTLGEELAGVVESVGKDVKQFAPGDHVFGTAGPEFGANSEYLSVSADGVLASKPTQTSFEEAASSVDGFLTALPFLRDTGKIKTGHRVLIYGASGSVGSAAVQIAKYFGAEVTAVCSTTNVDWVRNLGADHVIDYTSDDFTKSGASYDIIFDTVGKINYSHSKKSLSEQGVFLEAGIGMGILKHVLWTSLFSRKKAKIAATGLRPPHERKKDLDQLAELLEDGQIKPVIDKTYSLESICEAHAYVDQGHKKGNVVITVTNEISPNLV